MKKSVDRKTHTKSEKVKEGQKRIRKMRRDEGDEKNVVTRDEAIPPGREGGSFYRRKKRKTSTKAYKKKNRT